MSIIKLTNTDAVAFIDDADAYLLTECKTWARQPSGHAIGWHCPSKRVISLHQLIMGRVEGYVIDHVNRNPLDNRRCNLQRVTHAENLRNAPKYKGDYHSKHKGVSRDNRRNKWRAYSCSGKGKSKWLGYHSTEEAAVSAVKSHIEATCGSRAALYIA